MSLFLLILAIIPTIALGYFIYSNDKIEKEPAALLVELALGGVASVVLTLLISAVLYKIAPFFAISNYEILSPISLAIYVFFGIAIIEEFSKWIFLYCIAWKNKAFNHVYDAIVYSVFVSLGFATIENIMYIFLSEDLLSAIAVAVNRMLFSVPGHAFFGVMMGYYLGIAKLTFVHEKKEKTNKYLIYSLLVPALCHFLFDYLLMSSLPIACFYLYVVGLFSLGISKVKRLSNIPNNIFDNPNNMGYIYNAFGNNQHPQNINNNVNMNNQNMNIQTINNQNINNNQTNNLPRYCKNCGTPLIGPYCGHCGIKNY